MKSKKISENDSGVVSLPQKEGEHKGKDVTEIICIIDRSGSMESIRSDAIGGFNRFLADQQKPDDPARQPWFSSMTSTMLFMMARISTQSRY